MSKKAVPYNGAVMDATELDPCIAAESRMKRNLLSDRVKKIFFLLLAVIFILACFGLLVIFLSNTGDMDENYDGPRMVEEESDEAPAVNEELLDSEGTLFGKNNIHSAAILDSDEEKETLKKKVFYTPPPTTPRLSTTVRVPSLIPIILTTPTTTTTAAIITTTSSSTTTTASTSTTTAAPTRSSSRRRYSTTVPQPTVSVSIWSSLQVQPTNVPVTEEVAEDCLVHRESGLGSGIYKLSPDGLEPFYVFCDMETDGGGWTVIQRRLDGQEDFHNKYFKHYEAGFGNLRGNHWLGLQFIHRLAPLDEDSQTLRIELRGDTCAAPGCSRQNTAGFWWGEWDFSIGSHFTGYTLSVSDQINGNMTNPSSKKKNTNWEAMSNGMKFTTLDMDNDESENLNCAQFRSLGGWWHRDCTVLSLNGKYGDRVSQLRYLTFYRDGTDDSYHIKPRQSLMMIRPQF